MPGFLRTGRAKRLLAGAVSLAAMIAPAALAQTHQSSMRISAAAGLERVSVVFSYNPAAPAEAIYSDLQSAARKACGHKDSRLLVMRKYTRRCTAEMVDSGVDQIGRADIAELHKMKLHGARVTVASR
jgi:hypothetical protein